jgi:HEPN domain-containing protein
VREESVLPLRSFELAHIAREYLAAASVLASEPLTGWLGPYSLPWFQLVGQSLELSLKAFIAASGLHPPQHHDLIRLFEAAEQCGYEPPTEEHMLVQVVILDHWFHRHAATGTKYGSRYGNHGGGTVPEHGKLARFVESVIEQADSLARHSLESPR